MNRYYIPFIVALTISFLLTPLAKLIANKIGAIDIPKDKRRVHKIPIPRLGGLAIYLGTIISMLIFLELDTKMLAIITGGSIIVIVGIVDDLRPISAKCKFLAQIVAAVVLVVGGVEIDFISNPFTQGSELLYLKAFSIPITIFWIVGITNTLNLIDGLDGLASGVASIAATSLLFVSLRLGYVPVVIMSAIIAGSAFGFLPFNFNPAKIFMGDTGSLFLGYMLSVIAIEGVMKSVAAMAIILPLIVLGVPIFDTTSAIIRRIINKKPISEADKSHIHHKLMDKGFSQKQAVVILYGISGILGSTAILLTTLSLSKSFIILGIITSFTLIGATRLGIMDVKKSEKTIEKRNIEKMR